MRRGDFVTVAAPGDYGKPRPALIIGGQFTGFNNSPNLGWYDGIFRGVFAGGTNAPVRSLACTGSGIRSASRAR